MTEHYDLVTRFSGHSITSYQMMADLRKAIEDSTLPEDVIICEPNRVSDILGPDCAWVDNDIVVLRIVENDPKVDIPSISRILGTIDYTQDTSMMTARFSNLSRK